MKNDVDNYKKYIQLFISKFYIEVSQKQIEGIEKKENNYNIFDSNDIINEVGKNINNYTYDIILIKTLIDKDYINYNHYMNIEESYSYLLKKSSKFQKFLYELNMSENKQSQIIEIEIFFKPNIKNIELNGVNEYLGEIYTNLLIEEKNINIKPKIGYMKNQSEISEFMRAILIDWIMEVHFSYKFKQENYIESYNINRNKLSIFPFYYKGKISIIRNNLSVNIM